MKLSFGISNRFSGWESRDTIKRPSERVERNVAKHARPPPDLMPHPDEAGNHYLRRRGIY
jgi:hypothetical protein